EGHLDARVHAFAHLEVGDALLGLAADGLLPGDGLKLLLGLLELGLAFAAFDGETPQAHGDDDFFQARDGELVVEAQLLLERGDDLALEALVKPSGRGGLRRRGLVGGFLFLGGLRLGLLGLLLPAALVGFVAAAAAALLALGMGTFGLVLFLF